MDPSGLLLLEHLNVNVREWEPTQHFYEALGCQHAQVKIHMNCGPHTQFHLPVESPVQTWRGETTIAYTGEGLAATARRLASFAASEEGAGVDFEEQAGVLRLLGPWGSFVLREASPAEIEFSKLPTSRANTELTIANGVVGIVEVSLSVPVGAAAEISRFYDEVFGFEMESSDGEAVIVGGPVRASQRIRFRESEQPEAYTGDHFCIYIGDFEGVFERCRKAELLYVNPRFTFLDDSLTLEKAQHFQAFRIMDVKTEKELFTEEHEIRSRQHERLSLPRSQM